MASSNDNNNSNQTKNVNEHDSKEAAEFNALVKRGFEALMPAIRASNSLPKDAQWDLFCTSPSFKPIMDSLGNQALGLMTTIMQNQGIQRDIKKRDVEEKTELIVEANDKILERVGLYLDEMSGIRRNPTDSVADIPTTPLASASGSWNRDVSQSSAWKERRISKGDNVTTVVLRNARITQRPQVKFSDKIDNSSTPFEPRIKDKPNALKPLAILYESLPGEDSCYSHPYEFELERFQEKIGSMDLAVKKPQKPKPLDLTPLITVTQEHQLLEMLEDLRQQPAIAVDLEHHSYRSFQGFLCLMQISTRDRDYIIDTLELRNKLHILNEVFTDPKVVKVFHGADSDIPWLQRDLCLYVVNMFDTYQAALLLSLPRLSLAHLLKTYCNVDANKHFQLYDWRTRPLAKEAIKYAREDTHYLLYVYEVLWNQLIEKSKGGTQLLESAIFRSTDTCKKRYWKAIFKEDSHEDMYRKSRKNFDNRQMFAMKELYAWRDRAAREEDESAGYVLPNHMLLLIAEKLPKEMQGILACCNPIPPLVRQNLVLLHQIILKAREQPLEVKINTNVNNETRVRPTVQTTVNLEGPLYCPHDLTHNQDFRDNLPTLLDLPQLDLNANLSLQETKPILSIFTDDNEIKETSSTRDLPNQIHFMSPFDRYKKMITYLESEEKKFDEDEEKKSDENEEKKSNKVKEKEVQNDTQKLLDECMRERLKQQAIQYAQQMQALDNVNIKTENPEEEQKSRKRERSQDNDLIPQDTSEIKVKEEIQPSFNRKFPVIPKSGAYFEFLQSINTNKKGGKSTETTDKAYLEFVQSLNDNKKGGKSTETTETNDPPKKKQKTAINTIPLGTKPKKQNNQTPQAKKQGSFAQFDYNQVDYGQFTNAALSNKSTPKGSKDRFKPKGKKKQQNKSFTFARQHQGGGQNKKKS